MRVVLDTNVLISAFLFEKRLGKIIKLVEERDIIPCFVVHTFEEFKRTLRYKNFDAVFLKAELSPDEIAGEIYDKSLILDNPKIIPSILPHHNPDNYILAAGQVADAKYIVTGDKLLLSLKTFENIPTIPPREFLKKF